MIKKVLLSLAVVGIISCAPKMVIKEEPTLPKEAFIKQELKVKPELHPIVVEKDGKIWICFSQEESRALGEWVTDTEGKFKLQQLQLDKLYQRYYQDGSAK